MKDCIAVVVGSLALAAIFVFLWIAQRFEDEAKSRKPIAVEVSR